MTNRTELIAIDLVLTTLEDSGDWHSWTQLIEATGLTLFWVREALAQLMGDGMVAEKVEGGYKRTYRVIAPE